MTVPELDVRSLVAELAGPQPPRLLDVREADELAVSRLPNIVHVRLAELPGHLENLDRGADWVVVCRSGGRSAQATAYLLHQGFARVRNLVGGMREYARTVDPSMPVA